MGAVHLVTSLLNRIRFRTQSCIECSKFASHEFARSCYQKQEYLLCPAISLSLECR